MANIIRFGGGTGLPKDVFVEKAISRQVGSGVSCNVYNPSAGIDRGGTSGSSIVEGNYMKVVNASSSRGITIKISGKYRVIYQATNNPYSTEEYITNFYVGDYIKCAENHMLIVSAIRS